MASGSGWLGAGAAGGHHDTPPVDDAAATADDGGARTKSLGLPCGSPILSDDGHDVLISPDCRKVSVLTVGALLFSVFAAALVGGALLLYYLRRSRQVRHEVHKQIATSWKGDGDGDSSFSERYRQGGQHRHRSNLLAAAAHKLCSCGSCSRLFHEHQETCETVGLDGGIYLTMLWHSTAFFAGCSLLGVGALTPMYYLGDVQSSALFAFSIINTSSSSGLRWTVTLAQLAMTALSYTYVFRQWKQLVRYKFVYESSRDEEFSAAQHTILIKHLPTNVSRTLLFDQLSRIYPTEVLDVQCVLELGDVPPPAQRIRV
jgi:hypothetical protein